MRLKFQISRQTGIGISLVLFICRRMIDYCLDIFHLSSLLSALLLLMIFFLIIIDVNSFKEIIRPKSSVIFSLWILFLLISALLLRTESVDYLLLVIRSLLLCIPAYWLGGEAFYYRIKQLKYLRICPFIVSFLCIIVLISRRASVMNHSYSQYLGYAVLPAFCISVGMIINGNKKYFIFGGILLWTMIGAGARGPLLCSGLFLVSMLVAKLQELTIRNVFTVVVVVLGMILFLVQYDRVLVFLSLLLKQQGFNTRIIDIGTMNAFFESKGRNAIFIGTILGINKHLFFGTGVFRDRQFLYNYGYERDIAASGGKTIGFYPHNYFLEIELQFGVIIGTIIIIAFVAMAFNSVKQSAINGMMDSFILFLAIGFFPLLVSGSYITWEFFYLLVGYINQANREKEKAVQMNVKAGTVN